MNPPLQQNQRTLNKLLSKYTGDRTACCPSLTRIGLDTAHLLGVKVNGDGIVKLCLGIDLLPEAEALSAAEDEVAQLLGANQVQFCFKNLGLGGDIGNATELTDDISIREKQSEAVSIANEALRLIPWLLDDWAIQHGFAAVILKNSKMSASADGLTVQLPEPLRETMSHVIAQSMERFFYQRAGLEVSINIIGEEHDVANAAATMEQRMLAKVRKLQKSKAASLNEGTDFSSDAVPPWDVPLPGEEGARPAYKKQTPKYKRKTEVIYGRVNENLQPVGLSELTIETGSARFIGQVVNLETKLVSQGQKVLFKFDVFGSDGAIACRLFIKPEEAMKLEPILKEQPWCGFDGEVAYNNFDRDITATIRGIEPAEAPKSRQDNTPTADKRVELHCHTRMSSQDAMCSAKDMVNLAARFGHPAVAITDHGVVQSFPEAAETVAKIKGSGQTFKLIYGMEGYLVDDGPVCVYGCVPPPPSVDQFVALDLETTGLDPNTDRIIEVGAIRFRRGQDGNFQPDHKDIFKTFVNPQVSLNEKIQKLTGITDFDLIGAPDAFTVMQDLKAFIGADLIVGHNVLFDLNFMRHEGFRTVAENDPRIHFNPLSIDTVPLARHVLPELKRHRLNDVAKALSVPLESHHRALDDAVCAGSIFASLYRRLGEPALDQLNQLLGQMEPDEIVRRKTPTYHIVLLVQNYVGLYHLYRLVSESHIRYFNHRPRIPKSLLTYWRTGLLLGSACEAGEVFMGVKKVYQQANSQYESARELLDQQKHKILARYYDYLEVQPLTNNSYLLRVPNNGINTETDLINLNRLIIDLADLTKRPVVATGDSHYLEQEDRVFRKIMQTNMGYSDAENQPDLYFRTTAEMIACYANYLGKEKATEIVVTNTQAIAAKIRDDMRPFPDGSFPPLIASADNDVQELTWNTAYKLYGKNGKLPEIVKKRVERELKAIIDNGFAVMYFIAHKLVKKSNEDGYIVGSRGSVGSSLVASLCGITEVNPLVPHYRCINCLYSEFVEGGQYGSGFDLPPKVCPECGEPLFRDGQDIPFETFLGFDGDKQPDIDLNFSGEYQPEAHRYVVDMFGETHTYRAGTIGSYAEKNAEGLVRGYLEKYQLQANRARIRQLASGLNGVKRTTGQHPGGIVVIPKEREVYDFTPVQFPANDFNAPMTTTHFDFNSMHDTILKLDILGHMDPTMLKMLSDITGQRVTDIPIPDEKVMSLFVSNEALGLSPGQTSTDAATLGLPELGTPLARDMIRETTPSRFYNLVQLMGLSHGTDVWKGNAQELIRNGTCTIDEVIGCRDGIMTSLIHWGIPSKTAFDIMEKVRKGKGLTESQEALMREKNIPDWYIDSCKKIKYMFPKAHAAAYSISSLRIAWFKVYYPAAFYATYFTVRAARQFDSSVMCQPQEQILLEMQRLKQLFQTDASSEKDKKSFELLELVEEMYARGIEFLPVDVMQSEASRFIVESDNKVRPALDTIPGISPAMAEKIVKTREDGPFKSQEEVGLRCGLGNVALQALCDSGCLGDMPATNQIDLFSLMS